MNGFSCIPFIESSSTAASLMISPLQTAVVGLRRVQRRQKLLYRLYAERGAYKFL
jgi:hypothetical protein